MLLHSLNLNDEANKTKIVAHSSLSIERTVMVIVLYVSVLLNALAMPARASISFVMFECIVVRDSIMSSSRHLFAIGVIFVKEKYHLPIAGSSFRNLRKRHIVGVPL